MKRSLIMACGLGVGAMMAYVLSYFLCVREGGPSAIGISTKPAYPTLLSAPHAEAFFSPIHHLDRKWFRPAKWGDRFEKILTEPFVPQDAVAFFCKLHHRWRTTATVPIAYGTPDVTNPYYAALRKLFPNSWSRLEGGCVSGTFNGISSPTQAVVRVCPSCRDAERAWENAQNHR